MPGVYTHLQIHTRHRKGCSKPQLLALILVDLAWHKNRPVSHFYIHN
jgi:hypothetical protein